MQIARHQAMVKDHPDVSLVAFVRGEQAPHLVELAAKTSMIWKFARRGSEQTSRPNRAIAAVIEVATDEERDVGRKKRRFEGSHRPLPRPAGAGDRRSRRPRLRRTPTRLGPSGNVSGDGDVAERAFAGEAFGSNQAGPDKLLGALVAGILAMVLMLTGMIGAFVPALTAHRHRARRRAPSKRCW